MEYTLKGKFLSERLSETHARGSQEVGCTQPFGDELALQSRRGKARGKATSMKTIKRAKWPIVKGNKVARLNWGWVEFATFLGDTEPVVLRGRNETGYLGIVLS